MPAFLPGRLGCRMAKAGATAAPGAARGAACNRHPPGAAQSIASPAAEGSTRSRQRVKNSLLSGLLPAHLRRAANTRTRMRNNVVCVPGCLRFRCRWACQRGPGRGMHGVRSTVAFGARIAGGRATKGPAERKSVPCRSVLSRGQGGAAR